MEGQDGGWRPARDGPKRPRSAAWFLLPIFLGIVGGIIAFFVLREDDPARARNCLYLGLALLAVGIVLNIAFFAALPEFDYDSIVNV